MLPRRLRREPESLLTKRSKILVPHVVGPFLRKIVRRCSRPRFPDVKHLMALAWAPFRRPACVRKESYQVFCKSPYVVSKK
jgi:hypothetical protein